MAPDSAAVYGEVPSVGALDQENVRLAGFCQRGLHHDPFEVLHGRGHRLIDADDDFALVEDAF